MKYRAEIDGLRAVAVIPVILFHAKLSAFRGGFVGVDIFFVISGYLITTIILSELKENTFSLAHFYERRARRILPALFLVMLVSLPFAWCWLLPNDMKDFSQSLVATSTFSSNVFFWYKSNYWDVSSELKPLLHTWSLAVEEQYYIFFPLFLVLLWRYGKTWILGSFLLLSGISLFAAHWGAWHKPSAAFYLLPTRLWEIAIGAGIAFSFFYRKQHLHTSLAQQMIHEILGFIGILMIGYALFWFDETIPFPSLYALIPTLGAGLVILFSSQQTIIGRFLGLKPLVMIGLMSYSAYLWHQPLFAFARHRSVRPLNELTLITLTFLLFPLACLSWRYIEAPFRRKDAFDRKRIFSYAAVGSFLFLVFGLFGHITNGYNRRTTSTQMPMSAIDKKVAINYGLHPTCEEKFTLSNDCKTNDNPEILVWGDSYAMHLIQGIVASNPKVGLVQLTKSACGPFFDIAPIIQGKYPENWARDCLQFTEKVRKWLKKQRTIQYVVLSSFFEPYLDSKNRLLSRSGKVFSAGVQPTMKELKDTLYQIQQMGKTPILFSPPPQTGYDLGRCLTKATWFGSNLADCDFQSNETSQKMLNIYSMLKNISEFFPVVFLNELMCPNFKCKTHLGTLFLYRDTGHLSKEGSAALGKRFHFYKRITAYKKNL